MDRLTGKDAKLMMEALASVYTKEEIEQEVISEETQELEENRNQRGAAARANRQAAAAAAAAQGNSGGPTSPSRGALSMQDRRFARRSASPAAQANTNRVGQNIKVGSPTGPAQNQLLKKPAPAAPLTAKDRAYGPNSTLNKDQQAVNREYDRLRAKDPEAAAVFGKKMAARGAARSDFKIEKPTQAQSNPTAAQKQASVDAAIKSVNTPEKMNRPAPVGSALRAQQDKQAAAAKPAPRPMARPGARNADRAPGGMSSGRPAPKPVAGGSTAVGSAATKPAPAGGYQLPAGARPMTAPGRRPMARPGARNRGVYGEGVDIFDTIKEYLIDEGATEEEALKQMLTLTDEQRTEILEGSCGSKKKKKSKKGGY